MYKEQSCRVIFLLHRSESRIIAAPVRMLPVFLEEIALRDVRSSVWRQYVQLVHASMNPLAGFSRCFDIRLVAAYPWVPALSVSDNRQRKRAEEAGFVAVSRAASMASRGAPASPLLKCSSISFRGENRQTMRSPAVPANRLRVAMPAAKAIRTRKWSRRLAPRRPSTTRCFHSRPAAGLNQKGFMVLLPPLHIPPMPGGHAAENRLPSRV